jgi:acyl transferase domain-containing protein
MIGHSVGEYVAACLANVFSLPVALRLIAARGRMIQSQPAGSMLAIMRPESDCRRYVSDTVSIAAVNAPSLCVVSGATAEIEHLAEELRREAISCRRLHTSHAFHSAMMEPILGPFTEVLKATQLSPPEIPFISNVSGEWIKDEEATSPEYWTRHLRQGVMFAKGIGTILEAGSVALLEVGPGRTLTTLARQHPAIDLHQPIAASLPTAKGEMSDQAAMTTALGILWQADVTIDWTAYYADESRQRVPLPTYPFERKRYWIEPPAPGAAAPHCAPGAPAREVASSDPQAAAIDLPPASLPSESEGNGAAKANGPPSDDVVTTILQNLSGIELARLREPGTFLEKGFDSLFLTQVARAIQIECNVPITFRQLTEELNTIPALATYVQERRPVSTVPSSDRSIDRLATAAPRSTTTPSADLAKFEQQLRTLSGQIEKLTQAVAAIQTPSKKVHAEARQEAGEKAVPTRLPLTDGQREIWLASQFSEDASRTYNEAYVVTLRGSLSTACLEDCVQELVSRHDALRTTFLADGSAQLIASAVSQTLEVVDLSSQFTIASAEQSELEHLITQRVASPFDLASGPLARFILYKLAEQRHVLLIVFHHIVLDGWSWGTLLRELGELYQANRQGRSPTLKPAVHFAEYVKWRGSARQTEKAKNDSRYWRDRYSEPFREIELPTDHQRPAEKTYIAGHVRQSIDGGLTRRMREASSTHNCTLFSFLLASFNVWLQRITRQDDLIVGVPMAGQLAIDSDELPAGNELVGHCVNMLPIRSRCRAEMSFQEFLSNVNRDLFAARDHQNFTFGNLLEALTLARDASRVPIVSVSFNLARAHRCDFGDVAVDVARPAKAYNYFDLTIDVIDYGDHLELDCKYNRDLFERESVENWLSQLTRVLKQAVDAPNRLVSSFSLLDQNEREQLLFGWNATEMP